MRLVHQLFFCVVFASASVEGKMPKIGYFWHITDIHYDSLFSLKGDARRGCFSPEGTRNGRRPAGRFGDYNCDTPWDLLESAVEAMRPKHEENIDFVLWTGDVLSARFLPEARQLEIMRNVTNLLKRTFKSQFVFPALGHDDTVSRKRLLEFWRRWLPPESMNTFEKGGYYMIEQKKQKIQIVVLNTNVLTGGGGGTEEEARRQWDWLETVLAKCQHNQETVYLVGHIPPGVNERQKGALPAPQLSFLDHHNRRYLRIVRKYSDIITGQFFGHLHSDTFRIIYNENGLPVSWLMVAPSVTPRRSTDGPNNPGLRLYKFDHETGQVIDYNQYYLDLSKANMMDETDWKIEYNFSYYYGLTKISPFALHNLVDRFTDGTPSTNSLFAKYYVANTARLYDRLEEGNCDSSCALTHYCAVTRIDYREYRQCLATPASALASSSHQESVYTCCLPNLILLLAFVYSLGIT